MKKNCCVVLDIGGTKLMAAYAAFGAVSKRGFGKPPRLIKQVEAPTMKGGKEQARQQVISLLESVMPEDRKRLGAISIAVPGPMDAKKGVLIKAPNLPGWENLPLKFWIQQRFRLPVVLENDANAAALAEALWGAGKSYRYVFYATISTGIGTGFVLDKRLYTGKTGMALEGGHLSINCFGATCACGLKGCIEAYASGTALERRARSYFPYEVERCSPYAIGEAARKGDKRCQELIDATGEFLGIWLGNIINLLDPEVIVLGGGLTFLGTPLFQAIKKTVPQFSINPKAKAIPIVPARLKREVGLFGAAAVYVASLIRLS